MRENNMNKKNFGFIGGGRITRIMLEGFSHAGFNPAKIIVSDINPETLEKLKTDYPEIIISQDNSLPVQADIIFIALHPPAFIEFLNNINWKINNDKILISLTPKIKIEQITGSLNGFDKIIRMNPNAATIIDEGFNPVTFSSSFSDLEKMEIIKFFPIFGFCPEVEEHKLEAFAVITAMGPTYFWFQIYELMKIAKSFGLNEEEVNCGIAKMVTGAVDTIFKSNLPAEKVMDLLPVKPLEQDENNIKEIFRTKLNSIYNRLTN
jgi:pyrroline-5-carboxylate reductase